MRVRHLALVAAGCLLLAVAVPGTASASPTTSSAVPDTSATTARAGLAPDVYAALHPSGGKVVPGQSEVAPPTFTLKPPPRRTAKAELVPQSCTSDPKARERVCLTQVPLSASVVSEGRVNSPRAIGAGIRTIPGATYPSDCRFPATPNPPVDVSASRQRGCQATQWLWTITDLPSGAETGRMVWSLFHWSDMTASSLSMTHGMNLRIVSATGKLGNGGSSFILTTGCGKYPALSNGANCTLTSVRDSSAHAAVVGWYDDSYSETIILPTSGQPEIESRTLADNLEFSMAYPGNPVKTGLTPRFSAALALRQQHRRTGPRLRVAGVRVDN